MHDIWKDMFVLGLPILEKILRPVVVYAFLVVGIAAIGKTGTGTASNPFDLVVLLSVSNTVQNAIIGDDNSLTGGLIGADFLVDHQLSGGAISVWTPVAGSIDRRKKADVLIEDGKVKTQHLKRELICTHGATGSGGAEAGI